MRLVNVVIDTYKIFWAGVNIWANKSVNGLIWRGLKEGTSSHALRLPD